MGRAGRLPPLAPDRFEAEVRRRVADGSLSFSLSNDTDIIIDMYRRGFLAAFDGFRRLRGLTNPKETTSIYYGNLKWGDEHAEELAHSLRFVCQQCKMKDGEVEIQVNDNKFSEQAQQMLMDAVGQKSKYRRDIKNCKLIMTGLKNRMDGWK